MLMKKARLIPAAFIALVLATAGCGGAPSSTGTDDRQSSLAKTPTERVAMELADARELERMRKRKPALEAYQRIAKEFPDSPQAKVASDRIKALGGR